MPLNRCKTILIANFSKSTAAVMMSEPEAQPLIENPRAGGAWDGDLEPGPGHRGLHRGRHI
jgi:hypothetical protein